MAKMVDARDLKSLGTSRAGSIPAERTILLALLLLSSCGKEPEFLTKCTKSHTEQYVTFNQDYSSIGINIGGGLRVAWREVCDEYKKYPNPRYKKDY